MWVLYFASAAYIHCTRAVPWQCHSDILREPWTQRCVECCTEEFDFSAASWCLNWGMWCMCAWGDYECLRVHPGSTLALHVLLWPCLTLFLCCHWLSPDLLSSFEQLPSVQWVGLLIMEVCLYWSNLWSVEVIRVVYLIITKLVLGCPLKNPEILQRSRIILKKKKKKEKTQRDQKSE